MVHGGNNCTVYSGAWRKRFIQRCLEERIIQFIAVLGGNDYIQLIAVLGGNVYIQLIAVLEGNNCTVYNGA